MCCVVENFFYMYIILGIVYDGWNYVKVVMIKEFVIGGYIYSDEFYIIISG